MLCPVALTETFYISECVKKSSDLVTEKMNRLESKRRKMLKNQSKERRVLEQPHTDLQEALKVRTPER